MGVERGQWVGNLEVVAQQGVGRYAGQSCTYWIARCHLCGRLGEYPQVLLTHPAKKVTCCPVCRRGPCIVCGSEILTGRATTKLCSDFCRRINKAERQAKRNSEEIKHRPTLWQDRYKETLEIRKQDPEYNARYLERQREYKRNEYDDPGQRQRILARSAAYYKANQKKIELYRKERQRQKALAELMSIGQKLSEIKSNDNE